MTTETTYKFADLDEKAKERAIDWYREAVAQDWQPQLHDMVETLAYLGISVVHAKARDGTYSERSRDYAFSWSISYCQGDNAVFDGDWSARRINMPGLLEDRPTDTKLHDLCARYMALMIRWPDANAMYVRDGRHDSMRIDWALSNTGEDEDGGAFMGEAYDTLVELMKDVCSYIYDTWRDAYEFDTSEAALIEGIESNDYDFDENGERT
jgi:hypothetical protein